MTDSKITPGPWKFLRAPDRFCDTREWLIYAGDRDPDPEDPFNPYAGVRYLAEVDETEANARAIAEVPNMVAVLRVIAAADEDAVKELEGLGFQVGAETRVMMLKVREILARIDGDDA